MNEATDCTDVDECAENTDDCGNDACVNTEGGFTCSAATTTVATTTTWPEGCTCTQFTCMCTTTTVTPVMGNHFNGLGRKGQMPIFYSLLKK